MAKFDVVDLDLKKVSELELSDEVFGAEPNANLFYEVAKMQQINRRRQHRWINDGECSRERDGVGPALAPSTARRLG